MDLLICMKSLLLRKDVAIWHARIINLNICMIINNVRYNITQSIKRKIIAYLLIQSMLKLNASLAKYRFMISNSRDIIQFSLSQEEFKKYKLYIDPFVLRQKYLPSL